MTIQTTATGSSMGMGRLLLAATLATTFVLGVGAGAAFRDATSSDGGATPVTTALPVSHAAGGVGAAPTRGGMAELYAERQAAGTRISDGADTLGGMAEIYRDQQRQAAASAATPWFMRYGNGPTWYLVSSQQQADEVADAISYRNKTLLLEGKPLPSEQVLVVNNPLAQQAIDFAAADEQARRTALGDAGVTIVDLRVGGGR